MLKKDKSTILVASLFLQSTPTVGSDYSALNKLQPMELLLEGNLKYDAHTLGRMDLQTN